MAEAAKESAGPGWRQSMLPVFGREHSTLSSSGWGRLNSPTDAPLAGLPPSEPQNNVSWIRGRKTYPHAAFSHHTCSGGSASPPHFRSLRYRSYVTTSTAISFPGPSSFSSLSHLHHNYIWPQLPAVIFFFFQVSFLPLLKLHNPLGLTGAVRDEEIKIREVRYIPYYLS